MRKVEQQQDDHGFHLNIGEYGRVVWRKKYFLIVPLIISIVVSNIGVRFLVPIFEAGTIIRVDNRSSNRELERFVQADGRGSRDAETLSRMRADLEGSAFLDALIRQLRMDQDPQLVAQSQRQAEIRGPGVTANEMLYRRLRNFLKRQISVDPEGMALFSIKYADTNPEACYVIAEAITKLYIDLQRRSRMEGLQDVSDFSEEQLAVYKERLDRSERALSDFQRRMAQATAVANPVNESNIGMAQTVEKDLEVTIVTTESTVARIRERLVSLVGSAPSPERTYDTPEARRLWNTLSSRRDTELLRELSGSSEVSADPAVTGDEDVAILDAQQAVQRYINASVRTEFAEVSVDYRPLIAEYFYQQVELESLRQKQRSLKTYITSFRQDVALAPQLQAELARLEQDVDHNRTLYNTFQSSRASTQISEAVQSTELGENIVVVESATMPFKPVRPNRVKILVMAVMFGLFVGAGGLLLTEFADSSFRSVDEVEKQLGLKVLGTVPRFDQHGRWQAENTRRRAVMWAATSVLVVGIALIGFYFYGKSTLEQQVDLRFTTSSNER